LNSPEKSVCLTCEAGAPRLDAFLHEHITGLSRARLQALIREGCVQLAGKTARKVGQKVSPGARVEVRIPPLETHYIKPENIPLDIRHGDEHFLVVNKPPGMVVHPGAGRREGTLVGALLYHCRGQLSGIGGVERPGIVHRLDKDTSGLLIVAKSDLVHRRLSEALKGHRIRRRYMALVKGVPALGTGTIDEPIGRHPSHRTAMAVVKKNGRDSVTHYKINEVLEGAAFLFIRLETGRTHQIRVHLNHIGHPVIGDPLYGGGRLPRPGNRVHDIRFDSLIHRQALHAYRLAFDHPVSGESMVCEAEPPGDFLNALEKLRERTEEANPERP